MAASVQLSAGGSFVASATDPFYNFTAAVAGDRYAIARVLGRPHFRISATTDTNTAASSTNFALDLSAGGVTLASGALSAAVQRDIIIDVVARYTDTDTVAHKSSWRQRQRVGITSGEIILIGPKIFETDCRARFAATTDGSTTSVEVAAECCAPAWSDGAAPVCGAFSTGQATIQWLGANRLAGSITPLGANHSPTTPGTVANDKYCCVNTHSLTNGTSVLSYVGGTTDFALGLAAGRVEAAAYITPPCAVELVINSTPTPDTLLVGLVGIASVAVAWEVGITISDPVN